MTEFFKDLLAAANARVRSPFFGSIALVFILVNWKPVFYLFFADTSVAVRLRFFEQNTDWYLLYLYPIVGGVLIAVIVPWVKLVGAWIAVAPARRLHNLQYDESVTKRIYALENSAREEDARAKQEEAAERRKIDAAKRLEEANKISDQTVRGDLVREIEASRSEEVEEGSAEERTQPEIGDLAKHLLRKVAADSSGKVFVYEELGSYFLSIGKEKHNLPSRKFYVDYVAAFDELLNAGYLQKDRNATMSMTKGGYDYVKELDAQK